jgi:hypothetical protein
MEFDWLSALIGWFGGIPSGLVANWSFNRFSRKKRTKGDYFTMTYSSDGINFEGSFKTRISSEQIIESVKNEPKSTDKSM